MSYTESQIAIKDTYQHPAWRLIVQVLVVPTTRRCQRTLRWPIPFRINLPWRSTCGM